LDGLLTEDLQTLGDTKLLDRAWRGAEAYHFYMLAQKQFYGGQLESAVITALHLRDYDDIIDPNIIFSLLAIVSLHAGYYGTCSKAFIKLEMLENQNVAYYKQLAIDIFTKNKPRDPQDENVVCSNCISPMKET
jgi:WD repeat-containing protein 35